MRSYPQRVEDYTVPFLVMAGLLLFIAFFALAVSFGLIWVIAGAALIEKGFRAIERRKGHR